MLCVVCTNVTFIRSIVVPTFLNLRKIALTLSCCISQLVLVGALACSCMPVDLSSQCLETCFCSSIIFAQNMLWGVLLYPTESANNFFCRVRGFHVLVLSTTRVSRPSIDPTGFLSLLRRFLVNLGNDSLIDYFAYLCPRVCCHQDIYSFSIYSVMVL